MAFRDMLDAFAAAVRDGDGGALAALFTEDGVYDDVFYGVFEGREEIAAMLVELFHRDGRDFRWDFENPVDNGRTGYAEWLFSYTSATAHAEGTRVVFDGVGLFELEDGLIKRYRDICNGAVPLRQMGTPPAVLFRVIGKWQAALEARPGYTEHKEAGGGAET